MNMDQFRNLDPNNPGAWPALPKALLLVAVAAALVAAGWYFDWQDQARQLASVAGKEKQLRQEFDIKQRRAANLEAYQNQLDEMRKTFGDMLRQLPSRAEVAKLLVDISQTGLSSGLEFELFKPQSAITKEFYAELPVSIRVRGSYEEFAKFVSGVANLPRIVTLDSISIKKGQGKNAADDMLTMDLTARTYWYLEEGDEK